MKTTVIVPPTNEQGSYKTTVHSSTYETTAQRALWDYNSAREHDGLPPIKRMPKGTIYEKQYEFEIQGLYSGSWEMVTTEENRKDAIVQVKCYRENEPGAAFRIVKIRI